MGLCETVVGLNLRAGGVMEFYPFPKEAKELRATLLDSATIVTIVDTPKTFRMEIIYPLAQFTRATFPLPVPSWIPHNFRRSVTLRL
ncbi:hypothetical protein TrLO_g15331 [Triparma laevis f. longispina]|uniref:Uncharacterized protein n=1 Tax=Triparma laevis f. longispina TaxID=1714387 RepID=A0A9W7FD50_9STRA|nr:hypothetical protein TrLO_g15331 [Triparma laevis f. longispina]